MPGKPVKINNEGRGIVPRPSLFCVGMWESDPGDHADSSAKFPV